MRALLRRDQDVRGGQRDVVADGIAVAIEGVEVSYGPIRALQGVTLEIPRGEIVALIGANAAGKSTLLLAIAGIVPLKKGKISIPPYGDVTRLAAHERTRRLGVVLVPEGRGILSRLTVGENLAMGSKIGLLRAAQQASRAAPTLEEIFELFPVLRERSRLQAGQLSGGEQQMLALGRALLMDPDVLLIDEPSIGLAPLIVRQIFASLALLLEKRGATIFLAEQNTEVALALASHAYVLERGEIVLSGTAEEVARDPSLRAAYLSAGSSPS